MSDQSNTGDFVKITDSRDRIPDIFENDFGTAVEALIFASPEPLEDKEIARIVGCKKSEIPGIVEKLNAGYENWGRSFRIEIFGGKFRFFTLGEFDKYISRLAEIPRPVRLSRAALEVLSIIAYRQPATRAEIERIRGINPDSVLKTIMDKGLVEIRGRSDGPGRPLLYGTTREFLDFFGISDLSELPIPDVAEETAAQGLILKRSAEPESPDSSSDETE